MTFKKKVVIITGAGSGIGAAAAKMFSNEGARVVMVGRNEKKLAAAAARCRRCNSPLLIRADVSNDDDARRIIDETVKKFGQIDVLVNNAGLNISNDGLLASDTMETYDAIMSINLRAVVNLTSLAAPHLIKTKGNIVNVSSVGGSVPPGGPGWASYQVSKAGVIHFSVCAAVELGVHGVRVNTVSPGPVKTDFFEKLPIKVDMFSPMTILNRVSEPEEIAELILYLASDKAKGVTGSNYVNDNGNTIKR